MLSTMEYSNSTLGVVDHNPMNPNQSYAPFDAVAFLDALNDRKAALLAPAMTFTLVLMVVGIVGNPLCIYIYAVQWQKTTTRNFLLTLAVIDLVNCLITMPTEIALMRRFFYFDNTAICRLSRFTTYWMNNASSVVLLVIAIDRYIRICHPHAQAISRRGSVTACCVALVIGVGVSWPALVIYGQKHVPIPIHSANLTVLGVVCSVSDNMVKEKYPLAFFMYLWIAFCLFALSMGVLYTLIGKEILKRKRLKADRNRKTAEVLQRMRNNRSEVLSTREVAASMAFVDAEERNGVDKASEKKSRPREAHSGNGCAVDVSDHGHSPKGGNSDVKKSSYLPCHSSRLAVPARRPLDDGYYEEEDEESALSGHSSGRERGARGRKEEKDGSSTPLTRHKFPNFSSLKLNKGIRLRAGRSTLMLFAITVVYVLSFLPFLIVGIIREKVGDSFYPSLSPAEEVVVNIFIRSYLLNNCCNPIIYGLCNKQFRTELRRLYARIMCKPVPQMV